MNCLEVKRRLVDLIYSELAAETEHDVREHLAGCESCQSEWRALERARSLLDRTVQPDTLTRINVPRLYDFAVRQSEQQGRRWRRVAVLAGVAAVAAMMLTIAGVRVETYPTHMVIAWSRVPAPPSREPRYPDPWPTLRAHSQALDNLDELSRLTAQEVLDVDNRQTEALAKLYSGLSALSAENDRRTNLIARELTRQDAELAQVSRFETINQPTGGNP